MNDDEGQAEFRYYDGNGNLISKIDASAPLVMGWQRGSVPLGGNGCRGGSMTKADIIRMAREAGFDDYEQDEMCIRFAALVAAHKAEVALAEAYRCGYKDGMEAGAVICENLPMQQDRDVRDECANAIRARGNK